MALLHMLASLSLHATRHLPACLLPPNLRGSADISTPAQVAVPYAVLAAFHASAFASQAFGRSGLWQKYGRRAHLWLAGNQVGLGTLQAHLCMLAMT